MNKKGIKHVNFDKWINRLIMLITYCLFNIFLIKKIKSENRVINIYFVS